jgi:hypothetical protein
MPGAADGFPRALQHVQFFALHINFEQRITAKQTQAVQGYDGNALLGRRQEAGVIAQVIGGS